MTFYNENDPKAAAWLRELISAGHIAPGVVDERSITDLKATDLHGYTQCHFFAGIGGWSYALRLADWPDDEAVWTGSCPCQPLSCAGQRKGHADERHLWPTFYRLISECRPAIVFGEQVASPDGREWLAGIRADLEGAGYAFGASDLCAAGVGAPHPRQRLYWLANADVPSQHGRSPSWEQPLREQNSGDVPTRRMGNTDGSGSQQGRQTTTTDRHGHSPESAGCDGGMGDPESGGRREQWNETRTGRRGHADCAGSWSNFDVCHFTGPDAGKIRRIEAGTFPLADGIPARMGRLRGYGNAIVPQVAAEFIQAAREAMT